MAGDIATIDFGDLGAITLRKVAPGSEDGKVFVWTGSSDDIRMFADSATMRSNPPFYTYSPADGEPGCSIASDIRDLFGGELRILVEPTGKGDGIDGSELPEWVRKIGLENTHPASDDSLAQVVDNAASDSAE